MVQSPGTFIIQVHEHPLEYDLQERWKFGQNHESIYDSC